MAPHVVTASTASAPLTASTAAAAPSPGRHRRHAAPHSADEHRALVAALEDPGRWPDAAASLLAELGFRLIQRDGSDGAPAHHLLVALRDRPTLRHFDPEGLAYYAPSGEHASFVCVSRSTLALPAAREARRVLWGHVHVEDRLPVENRFLTFGGVLRAAEIWSDLTVLDLASPGPIVRWGGHSQGTDLLAQAIGAFFARLMVPIDFVEGMEARIDALSPETLYRAFVLDAAARVARAERASRTALAGGSPAAMDGWLARELRRTAGDARLDGAAEQLLEALVRP